MFPSERQSCRLSPQVRRGCSGAATGSCDRGVLTIGSSRDAEQQAIYREHGFMSDALHPSQLGHDDIAQRVLALLGLRPR
jgi:hypothetical protein